jgi:hypothetical protein
MLSCYITQRVYLVPPMINNILREQDNCYITQTVYLVSPMIYNILGEQDSCYLTQTVYLVWVELNKFSV